MKEQNRFVLVSGIR